MTRKLGGIAGAAVSGVGLWFAFHGMDWNAAVAALRNLRPGFLGLVVLPLALGTILRALRWHVLMRSVGSTPIASFEAVFVSAFFNGLMPFRAGEAARVVYFSRRTAAPVASAGTALILERALDVATLGLLALWVLPSRARLPALVLPPWALGALSGGILVALVITTLWMRRGAAVAGAPPVRPLRARLRDQAHAAFAFVSSPRDVVLIVLASLVTWPVTAVPGILVFRAAGVNVGFEEGLVILLVVAFAIALPSTPGFVGTFHAGFVLGATSVGVPREVAAPVALVTHLLFQVPFILAGALVLATGGSRLLRPADQFAVDPGGCLGPGGPAETAPPDTPATRS